MSMLKFSSVFERAKSALENNKSLVEAPVIKVAASTITFAYEHIHLLEEQLGQYQNLTQEWKAEAGRMLKINAQLCNILEDKGLSKEEIQKIVDYV